MRTTRQLFRAARELYEQTKIDIRCGRHSGFRPCCIAFFVGPWKLALRYVPQRFRDAYFGAIDGNYCCNVGYICCPLCVALNREPIELVMCEGPRGSCTPTDRKQTFKPKWRVRLVRP